MKTKKERKFVTIGDNFCHYLWRVGANFHNFQTLKKYANHQIFIVKGSKLLLIRIVKENLINFTLKNKLMLTGLNIFKKYSSQRTDIYIQYNNPCHFQSEITVSNSRKNSNFLQ